MHKNNTITHSVSGTTNLFESPVLNFQLTSTSFTQGSQKLSCKFQQITSNKMKTAITENICHT